VGGMVVLNLAGPRISSDLGSIGLGFTEGFLGLPHSSDLRTGSAPNGARHTHTPT